MFGFIHILMPMAAIGTTSIGISSLVLTGSIEPEPYILGSVSGVSHMICVTALYYMWSKHPTSLTKSMMRIMATCISCGIPITCLYLSFPYLTNMVWYICFSITNLLYLSAITFVVERRSKVDIDHVHLLEV